MKIVGSATLISSINSMALQYANMNSKGCNHIHTKRLMIREYRIGLLTVRAASIRGRISLLLLLLRQMNVILADTVQHHKQDGI